MSFQIRTSKASDKEFILSLVTRFTDFDLPQGRQRQEIDHTNHVAMELALQQPDPDSTILLAEDENKTPAGFIHLQTQIDYFNGEKTGYISDLAVDRSFEGQGVGRLLLEAAEDWAREKRYRLLSLYVFAGNTRARQVYENHGFQPEVLKYTKVIE